VFIGRKWFAVAPNGAEHEIVFGIRALSPDAHGDWVATVSLGILNCREDAIIGIDAWQAVELAMVHIARHIQHCESLGWRFFWQPIGESVHASELLTASRAF
jgi:hypothetical protein